MVDFLNSHCIALAVPPASKAAGCLGMPVAVSHHACSGSFGAEAAKRAWVAWLDQALTAAGDVSA